VSRLLALPEQRAVLAKLKARKRGNGVTTFHDPGGRVTGTARTDRNGVTTFRDAAGRTTGSIKPRP